ncbi:MAG: type II toxin-antitoxin system VapB family antitoxin [Holosporales bacterium]|jgi:antitoxin VapB
MVLSIKDPEADRLARLLSERSGASLTEVILSALREQAMRLDKKPDAAHDLADAIQEVSRFNRASPLLDARLDADILGYNAQGIPS